MQQERLKGLVEDLITNGIYPLSNEDYQKRVWFRHEGPEVASYSDTVAHFISRCDSIFQDPQSVQYLGKDNYFLLKKLYDSVIEHLDLIESRINVDELNEEELLNDPNWQDIQSLAESVHLKLTELVGKESQS